MNVNRDEINRQVLATDEANRDAMPRFGRALRRAFADGGGADRGDRAALLGLPSSRRGFLRVGGLSVAASAVLVACGGDVEGDAGIARTGTTPQASDADPPSLEPSTELDTTLLLTAMSIEALAIKAYGDVLDAGWLDDATLDNVAEVFRDQHRQHLDLLADTGRELGVTPYEDPNPFLMATVVQPELGNIEGLEDDEQQSATLRLAYALEDIAAQTYTKATGLLTTADLRQGAMSIGGVEARHVTVLLAALGDPPVPFAFGRTVGAIDDDGLVTTDGPVTEPPAPVEANGDDAEGDDES